MALFLDLDNTLFSSVPAYEYAIQQISLFWKKKKHGSAEEFIELYEKYRKKTKTVLAKHTSNRLRLLCFKQLIEEKYGRLNPALGLELDKLYYQYFKEEVKREQKKKKKEFGKLFKILKQISKKQQIVLVTNETLRTQLMKLSFFFPKNIPVKLVASEEVGIEKPESPIFQRALEVSNSISENCMMIGDSLKDDIGGAMRLGIKGIHLTAMFGKNKTLIPKSIENGNYLETDNVISALEYFIREM